MGQAPTRLLLRAAQLSRATAALAVVVSVTVLVGWLLDLSFFQPVLGLAPMKANTAAGYLLAGLALGSWHRGAPRLARACAAGALLVGGATLCEYATGLDLRIDQLLALDRVQRLYPGRMSPATATIISLLGLALLSLGARRPWLPQAPALAAGFVAVLAVAGYVFGVGSLRRVGPFVSIALHTALTGCALAAGVCAARPDGGIAAILVADDGGGLTARRLLPAALLAPFLLGWLQLHGERLGWYDSQFGIALVVLANVTVFSALIALSARALSVTEQQRRADQAAREESELARADLEVRLAEAERDRFFTVSLDILGVASVDGFFTRVNPAFTRALGHSSEEITSQPFIDLVHPDDRAATLKEVERLAAGQQTIGFENRYRCKDGSYRWIAWTCSPDVATGLLYAAGRDLTQQRQAEASLLRSEERWRSAFELAAVGVGLTTTEGRWVQVNQALCEIVGRSQDELLAVTFQEITHPDDLASDGDAVGRLLSGELKTYHTEKRYFHARGHVVWIHLSVSVVRGEGATTYFLALVQDITARKRAEDELRGSLREKDVLLREIHHRVKNNLQIVTSLLNLQLRGIEDGAARGLLRESQDRVKTMALVHEKLYQSKGLATLDSPAYLRDLVASLFRSYGAVPRISQRVEAQEVPLDIDAAVPLGLVVNELVSNALKHAFPDGRIGCVVVSLATTGDATTLTVKDDGVGLPEGLEARRSRSLGLQLVDGLATQLRGELTTTSGPAGTTFTLVFARAADASDAA